MRLTVIGDNDVASRIIDDDAVARFDTDASLNA